MPLFRYVELKLEFFGLQVPRARFLITQNPNEIVDPEHRTRLPGIVQWDLVKLVYNKFLKRHNINVFEILNAPMESILCFFHSCAYILMLM